MTDQELIGYLDRLDQKIDGLREESRQTREENRQTRTALEEEDRQTRVMLEGLRSEIQLLAEGVIGQGESFAIRHTEILEKLGEVKALVGPLYQDLNRRVKNLEERAERQTRDVIDVIRERFGKH